jgi:hypothetical protein
MTLVHSLGAVILEASLLTPLEDLLPCSLVEQAKLTHQTSPLVLPSHPLVFITDVLIAVFKAPGTAATTQFFVHIFMTSFQTIVSPQPLL